MSQVKYKAIDKRLITQGQHIAFSLYQANEEKTAMTCFLEADSVITGDNKVYLRGLEHPLFVTEDDYDKYKLYAQSHLQSIATATDIDFEEKASILYTEAENVMNELFKNPEALGSIEKTQVLVNGFVDLVLQDESTVESLMKIAAHDFYTHTHSINVSVYTLSLANFMGLKDKDINDIGMSSMMHDLGKSKVDWEIINKNGKLTDDEFDSMKKHPAEGYDIAVKMGITDKNILSGIRSHHEKLDGKGYPDGLKDKQIPLFARIIAVCDVFDALTTKRTYKEAMSSFEAIAIMKKQMQGHLDMKLVNELIKMCSVRGER